MVNKLLLLGLLSLCCSSFLVTKTFGFRHQTIKITTSASAASHRRPKIRKGPSAASLLPAIHFQQQRYHPNPNPSLSLVVARQRTDSSRLHALFGDGRGFGINFSSPPPPIRTKKDIWQRLQLIVTGIVRQFMSGFISGYLLGSIWGLLRGPSLIVANGSRGMLWGLDFGFLSALFASTSTVTEFLLALRTTAASSSSQNNRKSETNKSNDDDDSNNKSLRKRQQKASLWSVVIRNMILAIYFGRNGGIVKMARLSALYGGLTYYFVGNKIKRDNAERMSIMFGANNNHPGSSAEAIMQQFLQQMMAMQHQQQGHQMTTQPPSSTTTRMGTPPPPPQPKSTITPPSRPSKSSSSSASSSSLFTDKYKSKKYNAVDAEFEKVDKTDKD